MLKQLILILVVILSTTWNALAQTESEIRAKAETLFNSQQFVEATPLYLRLLSLEPKNYDYCYRYGACLLYNSNNKTEAIRYLTYAIKSPTAIAEAHYYLGKAYHLNYQFNDAIASYKTYVGLAPKGNFVKEANRNIAMCENGKTLLSQLTDIIVRKKTEIRQEDFFRLYEMNEIGGSLIYAVNFQTKNDKKNNHKPVVHIAPNMENVYFSSYGDGDNLDIFVAKRLPDGKFGPPQRLDGSINTAFDEDFPYLHQNGKEIYFSSKGHNSMGGYDIFRAEINANGGIDKIENVDFAINSPDDDILYITDKDNKNAYFSSRRSSQEGKITVYKVGINKIPIQLAIIKGNFYSSVLKNEPKMTVQISEKTSGKIIGTFNSQKDNSYLIVFPKAGKYVYRVNVEGAKEEFIAEVDLPFLEEMRPLKQRIDHELHAGVERIRITNLFNEQFEDAQSIVSLVLNQRANLNVNEDQFNEKDTEVEAEIAALLKEMKMGNKTLLEVTIILDDKANKITKGQGTALPLQDKANGLSVQLYSDIQQLDEQVKKLVKDADASESSKKKENLLLEAKDLLKKREEKLAQIDHISKEAKNLGQEKSQSLDGQKIVALNKEIQTQFATGNLNEIKNLLTANKEIFQQTINDDGAAKTQELVEQHDQISKEIARIGERQQVHKNEVSRISKEINEMKSQQAAAKEKEKPALQDKIDDKQNLLTENQQNADKLESLKEKENEKLKSLTAKINLVNGIETYTGKGASSQEVEQAKNALNYDKVKTLGNYIDASLASISQQQNDKYASSVAVRSVAQYNEETKRILSNSKYSAFEKKQQLLELNNQKRKELENNLAAIDADAKMDASTKASEKTKIQELLRQLQEDQQDFNKDYDQVAKSEISKLSTENILAELLPNFTSDKQQIQNNKNLSPSEKTLQLNELNLSAIKVIDNEVKRLRAVNNNASIKNPLLEAKADLLAQYASALEKQIIATPPQGASSPIATTTTVVKDLQSLHEGPSSDFAAVHKNSAEAQKNIDRLNVYQEALLEQIDASNNLETSEEQRAFISQIEDELIVVQSRIIDLETQIDQLEGKTQASTIKSPEAYSKELQGNYFGSTSDFSKTHTNQKDAEANLTRVNTYRKNLLREIDQSNNLESAEEQQNLLAAIEDELARVDERTSALEQQISELKTGSSAPTIRKQEKFEGELAASYFGSTSDFSKQHTSTKDVEQNLKRLEVYQKELKKREEESSKLSNPQERQNLLKAIDAQRLLTETRIAVLEEQLLEQQQLAQNQIAANTPIPSISTNSNSENSTSGNSQETARTQNEVKQDLMREYPGNVGDFTSKNLNETEISEALENLVSYKQLLEKTQKNATSISNNVERKNVEAVVKSEIEKVDKRVADLQNQQAVASSNAIAPTQTTSTTPVVASPKTESQFAKELTKLYEGKPSDFTVQEVDLPKALELQKQLTTYKSKLQTKKGELEQVSNPEERSNLNKALTNELKKVDQRLAEINQQIEIKTAVAQVPQGGTNATENTTSNENGDIKTSAVYKQELQASYTGTPADFVPNPELKSKEIDETLDRLIAYKQALNKRKNEAALFTNAEEKQNLQSAIEEELAKVNKRIKILNADLYAAGIKEQEAAEKDAIATKKPHTIEEATSELQAQYPGKAEDFTAHHSTVEGATKNLKQLEAYSDHLKKKMVDAETTAIQKQAITAELQRTKKRMQAVDAIITSLSGPIASNNQVIFEDEATPEGQAIAVTSPRAQEITAQLSNADLSKAEKKELTEDLVEIKNQEAAFNIAKKESQITSTENQITNISKAHPVAKSSLAQTTENYEQKLNALKEELAAEKQLVRREMLVNEIAKVQETYLNDLVRATNIEDNQALMNQQSNLRIYSESQLKSMMRRGVIEIDRLYGLKKDAEQRLSEASKKDRPAIEAEIQSLNERIELVEKENVVIKKQMALYKPVEQPLANADAFTPLNKEDIDKIASSPAYKNYATAVTNERELVQKHQATTKDLAQKQAALESVRSPGSIQEDEAVRKSALIEEMKQISDELNALELAITKKSTETKSLLPKESTEKGRFETLAAKGINPIERKVDATSIVSVPTTGIDYSSPTVKLPTTETTKLPVNVAAPKGLVYRVQVGAFSKPIPENTFNDFSPVTGEEVASTGITRYLAGYFVTPTDATVARDKIRNIGYPDAFVVAYCDGKRITIAEAKRLQEEGLCVPQRASELRIEVAEKIVENLGITEEVLSKIEVKAPVNSTVSGDYSYNQAPGAAKAIAIEQFPRDVLFFTVQVGVFNRPVEKERLFNLEPLYTIRLDNGQMRYSVGMFGSYETAKVREGEIRPVGIPDAYVTAYFDGKRISIDEAKKLIANGVKLYVPGLTPTTTSPNASTAAINAPQGVVVKEVPLFTTNKVETSTPMKYVQFVSKSSYPSYPREEMNRFNAKGNFFYDQQDRKIKSIFYPRTESLPRIMAIASMVDTVVVTQDQLFIFNKSKVKIYITETSIPGDYNDFIQNLQYRKTYLTSSEGIEIHIFDLSLEDLRELRTISAQFGFKLEETVKEQEE